MSDSVSEYLVHTVSSGERWDQIAARYYGDATQYHRIVSANPYAPIWAALPEGLRLKVPVIAAEDLDTDLGGQPPWR